MCTKGYPSTVRSYGSFAEGIRAMCQCNPGFCLDPATLQCTQGQIFTPCDAVTPCRGPNQVCVVDASGRGNCFCQNGFVLVDGQCVRKIPTPPPSTVLCQASGDPHYLT